MEISYLGLFFTFLAALLVNSIITEVAYTIITTFLAKRYYAKVAGQEQALQRIIAQLKVPKRDDEPPIN